MVKIVYKIIAVREREDLVNDLVEKLGGESDDVEVLWDEEHKGCMWNALRVWKSFNTLPNDVTHICLLADDSEVVNNFKRITHKCVSRFPDAIWTFASSFVSNTERLENTPYVKIWNCNTRGICYLMSKELAKGYVDFYNNNLSMYPRWTHDDTTCKMYALLNHITVMMPIPNLVVNKGSLDDSVQPVIKGHKNIKRNITCWYGRDIDEKQFETSDFGITKGRSIFDLHLNKNEPICKKCINEFDRLKRLDRAINN